MPYPISDAETKGGISKNLDEQISITGDEGGELKVDRRSKLLH